MSAMPVGALPTSLHTLLAIVRRGVADQRRPALVWGLALGAMSALMAALWPSIEGSVDELMRSYPDSLKDAFGITELDSVELYIDAEMLSFIVPLAVSVFAIRCVARATVGAEEDGHLDTLLSWPVSRVVLVLGTMIATGITVALVLVVVWGMTLAGGAIAGSWVAADTIGAGLASVWPLAMAFAGLAALTAGLLRRSALVTGVAAGTLVAMYVLDLVAKLADVEALRALSAFRLYGSAVQDGLDASHVAVLVLAAAALAAVGAVRFGRRDIA